MISILHCSSRRHPEPVEGSNAACTPISSNPEDVEKRAKQEFNKKTYLFKVLEEGIRLNLSTGVRSLDRLGMTF
jgi:hypothetical protein